MAAARRRPIGGRSSEGVPLGLREKSKRLEEEALEDIRVGCYNKAVSAAYFAVRLAAESKLRGLRTRRDDKIANALARVLSRTLGEGGAELVRREYLSLFEARKLADHRPYLFSREEAEDVVSRARKLLRVIEEI